MKLVAVKYSKLLNTVFLLLTINTFGQSAKSLVQNSFTASASHPIIEIKWYSQNFIHPKGVNVYRRVSGESNWTRITNAPILMAKTIPAAVSQRDEDVEAFFSMTKELNSTKNNGFMLLNLFVKSFQSADFSKLIGIQWDDKDIIWGNTYEYRITQLVNATE